MNQLQELKRQGLSISQISALTGFDRKTIRRYLREPQTPIYGPRQTQSRKLDPHKPYLEQRLQAGVWNAVVLLREIKAQGYTGGYSILKDYLRPLRRAASVVAVRRFETPPGHQAQVDWAEMGEVALADGTVQKLSAFVLTLGYSRAQFAGVATDQRLVTFLRMHEEAFGQLGGVPQEILYDRVKTVVLGTDERGEIRWNPTFRDFANYWGFTPRLCRPYRPQTKGKVEAGVKYVRGNFLCGRAAGSVDDLRAQLRQWVWNVANERVHGTTHRQIRLVWSEEKAHLSPVMGRLPYPLVQEVVRRVSRDAYVSYRNNRYSVPWTAAGQEVCVREEAGKVWIVRGNEPLAVHALCSETHQSVMVAAHHAGIPLGGSGNGERKRRIHLVVSAPEVQVRPLSVYDSVYDLVAGDAVAGGEL